jgi:hypothetical protein
VYYTGRSSWDSPLAASNWEKRGTSDDFAAPPPVQKDADPSLSTEEFKMDTLSRTGWKLDEDAGAYANLGRSG